MGTPAYMAPEIVRQSHYTTKSDIWSFGVLVFEMVVGRCPFREDNVNRLFLSLGDLSAKIEWPPNPAWEFHTFVQCCMDWSQEERPTCRELATMSFLTGESNDREIEIRERCGTVGSQPCLSADVTPKGPGWARYEGV